MLHLISQFSAATPILERIDTGDSVVFLDNAVLRLLRNGNLEGNLTQLLLRNRFYVLADDLVMRGITTDELIKGIEVIDYPRLVALTVEHHLIQTWS
ncbi:MAG: sulfurtransferase complex subunit TusB [Methylosarcina sp.]